MVARAWACAALHGVAVAYAVGAEVTSGAHHIGLDSTRDAGIWFRALDVRGVRLRAALRVTGVSRPRRGRCRVTSRSLQLREQVAILRLQ